ncbi:GT2 family glycosyltransferase [Streptomyces olivoverticillatus]|uniref:GT2 family glycosyltransferase n=1 Tax=Streptomyces olivoverticillatus TaxID=66427 RepID=A0A7W7LLT5_9ACTN|nr:glycosyltransferase family 2 protein [Streptomyces olivoverticillatus]MBB4892117.1 GT2 family glycosyltransferase [Streptomyces olivoverticillatus]
MAVNDSGTPAPAARVSVIVIGYDDARHIGAAVRSALTQGPAVAEVIAVDDASTDRTAAVLARLAARDPRLRVIHRAVNSGGCGTPRNDGLRAAGSPYVMFLDSDDVLPHGAVAALLRAALHHGAPVAAGLCVRRELPRRRETLWQPALYRRASVHDAPEDRPELLHDTLCVNKLYARAFLTGHGITFPEGRFPYEDFVFTARVLAAAPRIATVPDPVYIWHVRRDAARPSISLDRERVDNWQARVFAHQRAVEVFLDADRKPLARAARVKFLDHDLRLYVRELPGHGPAYRRAWWRVARGCLAAYGEAELTAARAPARWIARVVLASEAPRDLDRLAQLAARPARLLPPYAEAAGSPVWAEDLPQAVLDGLTGSAAKPARRLPVAVDARLRVLARPRTRAELRLHVHELYGRLAAAEPRTLDVELRLRDGTTIVERTAPLRADGDGWTARLTVDLAALAALGRHAKPSSASQAWDVRVRLHFTHGGTLRTAVRAVGDGRRRCIVPGARNGVLLVQPYATASGSLALRLAPGVRGALGIASRRLRGPLLRRADRLARRFRPLPRSSRKQRAAPPDGADGS